MKINSTLKKIPVFILYFLIHQNFYCQNIDDIILNFHIIKFDVQKNKTETVFEIINNSEENLESNDWELHWNQMKGFITKNTLPRNIDFKYVNGQHYFKLFFGEGWDLNAGERLNFKIKFEGIIDRKIMGPVGVFIVNKKNAFDIKLNTIWREAEEISQLKIPTSIELYETYPNDNFKKSDQIKIIPTPKLLNINNSNQIIIENWNVKIDEAFEKNSTLIINFFAKFFNDKITMDNKRAHTILIRSNNYLDDENYLLEIKSNLIIIESKDIFGIRHAIQSLRQINSIYKNENIGLPIIKINDGPRFSYRGFMLDISRNFFPKKKIMDVLDVLSLLKLNYLELRLTDDEGWRIEIPGLPELTQVGAQRGYTEDEQDKLIPAYGSGALGLKNGNGYLSKKDFKEILVYADKLGVKVIPQISFPSHARAAIKAMEARYLKFINSNDNKKATKYLLNDFDDKSIYRSAQGYNDNIICICMKSPYTFFKKVFNEINKMYNETGVKLEKFSIGADEVPYGVWKKSKICKEKFGENMDVNNLYDNNLRELFSIIKEKGVTMTGWEDVLLIQSSESQHEKKIKTENFNYEFIPYVWNNTWKEGREDMIYRFANLGFETIMSNSSAFYFDMADNKDFENYGLNWSGYVDYFDTWAIDPLDIFSNNALNEKHGLNKDYIEKMEKIKTDKIKNFLGIQSQLWTETVINNDVFDELFIPNIVVFAEKSWSKRPQWLSENDVNIQKKEMNEDWDKFTSFLGHKFLSFISNNSNFKFHLPKPGGKIFQNKLILKSQFPGLTLRYSTDGTIPGVDSKIYFDPIDVSNENIIYARSFDSFGNGGKAIKIIKDEK